MEVWPAIDLFDGKVVRLVKGDPSNRIVYSNEPVKVALEWEKKNVTGIHVVDLNAALGLGDNRSVVKEICGNVSVPVQFGGGLRTIKDVEEAFRVGVSRVILGSAIFYRKIEVDRLLSFGGERVIVALDHRNGKLAVDGWKTVLDISVHDAVRDLWAQGFRLFLSTNTLSDGTLKGFDVGYLKEIGEFLGQTYVAGGISSIRDIVALKRLKVRGVILGRALYEHAISIEKAVEVAYDDTC